MIKEAIVKIVNKGDLSYDEAYLTGDVPRKGPRERRALLRRAQKR